MKTSRKNRASEIIEFPKEASDYLHNPGMGILYLQRGKNKMKYEQVPEETWCLKEKLTDKITMDIPWSMLEPKEGAYEWDHPDWEGCFNTWIKNGYKVAIEVRGMATLGTLYNDGTPQWVFDAGAKYIDESPEYYEGAVDPIQSVLRIDNRPLRFPVYWDPVYLEKANNLVHALGKRYNNNPNIEFVMIGHMGAWGEMHISGQSPVEPWLDAGLSLNTYADAHKKIIGMYRDAFPDKPLVQELSHPSFNDVNGKKTLDYISIQDTGIISYLIEQGVWLKYNGLGAGSFSGEGIKEYDRILLDYYNAYYPKLKCMLENLTYLEGMKFAAKCHISYWNRGGEMEGFGEARIGDKKYAEALFNWWNHNPRKHASLSLEDERDIWRYIARNVGYRFVLKELRHPARINAGEKFLVRYKWKNKGSAPCYKDYGMLLALVDRNGGATIWEDMQSPGIATSSSAWDTKRTVDDKLFWIIPENSGIRSGVYDLYVGMRDMNNPGVMIELAIAGKDNKKRYKVGKIEVR